MRLNEYGEHIRVLKTEFSGNSYMNSNCSFSFSEPISAAKIITQIKEVNMVDSFFITVWKHNVRVGQMRLSGEGDLFWDSHRISISSYLDIRKEIREMVRLCD